MLEIYERNNQKDVKDKNSMTMFFTKTLCGKNFVRHRVAAIKGFFMNAFSFREMIALVLPARISSSRASFMPRYTDFLKEKSEKEILSFMEKNYPNILENTEGDDLLSLVYEIMVTDQYAAKKFLQPDSIAIDAGANIGVFSIFASLLSPKGRIFAFEPVKNTYNLLKINVSKFPQVVVFNQGLGDEEKTQEILTSSKNVGMNAMMDSELASKNKRYFDGIEKVEITTIDSIVKKENIPRVDFIKIDTEGYEAQILEGARGTIQKWKPTIAMSAYHNKNDKQDLPILLKSMCREYVCELHKGAEEDLICYVKDNKKIK